MDRIEQSKQKYAELFGNTDFSGFVTDPQSNNDPVHSKSIHHFITNGNPACHSQRVPA